MRGQKIRFFQSFINALMLTIPELQQLADTRLSEAETLYEAEQYDGAAYLCGYAIELSLKARICHTLGWQGYPSTRSEFQNYQSFRTHDLKVLLRLSGFQNLILTNYSNEWATVIKWDSEIRYSPIRVFNAQETDLMIKATKLFRQVL